MGLGRHRAGEAYSHVKGTPCAVLLGNTLFDVAEPNHSLILLELI